MSDSASSSPSSSASSGGLRPGEMLHLWTLLPIASLDPSLRPPSPPPVKDIDRPPSSGWGHEAWSLSPDPDERPPAPIDPVWSFNAREYPTGWMKADAVAASLGMNVAYDAALQWGERVRRLQMQWHREHEYNLNMYGHGPRGDIAPHEVHAALDAILSARSLSPPLNDCELDALHARMDIVWLRHSRSPPRLGVALHRLRIRGGALNADELVRLSQVVTFHCLVDFQEVLICIDPRASVLYGRTRESDGVSRRWMSLGRDGVPRCKPYVSDPQDDQRSEVSGSSDHEATFSAPPYSLSRSERAYQIYRHTGRDYERVMREVAAIEEETARIEDLEIPMRAEIARRRQALRELELERNEVRIAHKGTTEPSF